MSRRLSALGLVLVLAGCGSGSAATKSSSTGSIPAGAAKVSAKAQLFATVDSSFGDQWDAFTKLVDRFPIRGEAIDSLKQSLAQDGVDFDKDIKATVGPEVDFAAWNLGDGRQPRRRPDPAEGQGGLRGRAEEGLQPARRRPRTATGCSSPNTRPTSTRSRRSAAATLDDDASLQGRVRRALRQRARPDLRRRDRSRRARCRQQLKSIRGPLGSLGLRTGTKQKLEWVAAGVEALEDGFKLDGVAKTEGLDVKNFDASFFDQVPAGAFLAAAFDGSGDALDAS